MANLNANQHDVHFECQFFLQDANFFDRMQSPASPERVPNFKGSMVISITVATMQLE